VRSVMWRATARMTEGRWWPLAQRLAPVALGVGALLVLAVPLLAQQQAYTPPMYGEDFPLIGSRAAIWIVAQVHLMFAAFVLGVPMFAVVTEAIGIWGKDDRYDRLSKEFTRLLLVAYSATALLGGLFLFLLVTLYPGLFSYLSEIFKISMWVYAGLFFAESATLYMYYYGWDRWKEGWSKIGHWGLGLLLNVWGTAVLFIANAWLTFMMSPPGDLLPDTAPGMVQFWSAFANATWMPINIHRLIANAVFGGSIVAAYAAYRFLKSRTPEERAHYDWMGYVGNFIAIGVFLVLPFAGYWLGREIYEYNQQMGVTMMGGFMSWLWIVQAFLIGVLFLAANYYLWIGLGRIPGGERFSRYTKWMLAVLVIGFIVWATPHSMIADRDELAAMGGTHHPFLGVLGLMSAKNTAVNLMILTTFLSFLMYRRANKIPTVSWARTGTLTQGTLLGLCSVVVIFYGVYGYFVPTLTRIGFSVYQVLWVLFTIVAVVLLDLFIMRRADTRGPIRWGEMPERSQYALFVLVVTFTWLMGLMGFARSGIRQHWHVWEVMRDTTEYAATPALGYAAQVISVCVIIFLLMIAFVFWIGGMIAKPELVPEGKAVEVARSDPSPSRRGDEGPATGPGWDPNSNPSAETEEALAMSAVDLKIVAVTLITIAAYTVVANVIPRWSRTCPRRSPSAPTSPPRSWWRSERSSTQGVGGAWPVTPKPRGPERRTSSPTTRVRDPSASAARTGCPGWTARNTSTRHWSGRAITWWATILPSCRRRTGL
jgi:cytochrome bd ubiquinol oxidase subunit I